MKNRNEDSVVFTSMQQFLYYFGEILNNCHNIFKYYFYLIY